MDAWTYDQYGTNTWQAPEGAPRAHPWVNGILTPYQNERGVVSPSDPAVSRYWDYGKELAKHVYNEFPRPNGTARTAWPGDKLWSSPGAVPQWRDEFGADRTSEVKRGDISRWGQKWEPLSPGVEWTPEETSVRVNSNGEPERGYWRNMTVDDGGAVTKHYSERWAPWPQPEADMLRAAEEVAKGDPVEARVRESQEGKGSQDVKRGMAEMRANALTGVRESALAYDETVRNAPTYEKGTGARTTLWNGGEATPGPESRVQTPTDRLRLYEMGEKMPPWSEPLPNTEVDYGNRTPSRLVGAMSIAPAAGRWVLAGANALGSGIDAAAKGDGVLGSVARGVQTVVEPFRDASAAVANWGSGSDWKARGAQTLLERTTGIRPGDAELTPGKLIAEGAENFRADLEKESRALQGPGKAASSNETPRAPARTDGTPGVAEPETQDTEEPAPDHDAKAQAEQAKKAVEAAEEKAWAEEERRRKQTEAASEGGGWEGGD